MTSLLSLPMEAHPYTDGEADKKDNSQQQWYTNGDSESSLILFTLGSTAIKNVRISVFPTGRK